MAAILERYEITKSEPLMFTEQSSPFSHGFHLASEGVSHSESSPSELTTTWEKRENVEQSDTDEDLRLNDLMEDIKRYIRSIDVGNL